MDAAARKSGFWLRTVLPLLSSATDVSTR